MAVEKRSETSREGVTHLAHVCAHVPFEHVSKVSSSPLL